MTETLPAIMDPLTPPDCDCRGLPFMPLEVTRLLDSELVALSTGDEFKAAFLLWAKSWTQVPAASVPDDDRLLARWAGYSLSEWRELREMALRGWVKCSDGRLYHPVIADLAVAASEKRRGQAERANSRWARARAAKVASASPQSSGNATASARDATASTSGAGASATAMQVKGKVEGKDPPHSPPLGADRPQLELVPGEPEVTDPVEVAFNLWNDLARRCGLAVAKVLDDARRRPMRKRLEDAGLDGWREALKGVEQSAFLRGQRPGSDGRTMRADLGFVCQAKSFQRLREGFYGQDAVDTAPSTPIPPWGGPPEIRASIVAETDADFAASYIDPSGWKNGPDRLILCRTQFAADMITRGAPKSLRKHGAAAVFRGAA